MNLLHANLVQFIFQVWFILILQKQSQNELNHSNELVLYLIQSFIPSPSALVPTVVAV